MTFRWIATPNWKKSRKGNIHSGSIFNGERLVMLQRNFEIVKDALPPMAWSDYEKLILDEWKRLLSSDKSREEKHFQHFFEQHPCMLSGVYGLLSSPNVFPSALISKPVLPDFTRKIPDFLWITFNSVNLYPILIEIESPRKQWFTKKGRPTAGLTQAHDQLKEWKTWFSKPRNAESFADYYRLPTKLRGLVLKPIYVLIYGRRSEANRDTDLSKKRTHLQGENEILMTFDRLKPSQNASNLINVKFDREGYYAISIPPTIYLDPFTAKHCWRFVRQKEEAAMASPYLSKERKEFLIRRFKYWDNWANNLSGGICYGPEDRE